MKIGVLTEIINTHSGSRAPLEIARYLARRGNEIILFAYNFSLDKKTCQDLEKDQIRIIIINKPSIPILGKYLAILPLLKSIINTKPQIMTFSGTPPFFFAAKLSGIPVVRIYQGTQFDALLEQKLPGEKINFGEKIINFLANIVIYLIDFLSFRLSTGVVAISQYASLEGKTLYRRPVEAIIYHGCTKLTGKSKKISKTQNIINILSVSRLTPYKGFHLIIKALKQVKTNKKLLYTVVGSQPKIRYLNYLKTLGEEKIQILVNPPDTQLAQLYQQADIYASADRYLYFGLPITEAAYFEKPTVSLNLAAASELIKHNATGFIAQNNDKLIYYLEKLINNSNLRKKMGQAAKKRAIKLFNWEKTAYQYEAIFKKILTKSKINEN